MPTSTRSQVKNKTEAEPGRGYLGSDVSERGVVGLPIKVSAHQDAAKDSIPARARRMKRGRWRGVSFATWNSMGLTAERVRYVEEDIGKDIMVLTEIHGKQTDAFALEDPRFFGSGKAGRRDKVRSGVIT